MCLTKNSRLINGCENSGQCFLLLPVYHLFNMAERKASTLESINHGHYIYKKIWWPLVGEILTLEWEEGTKFTVSLLKDATVIRHVSCFYCLRSSLQLVASAEQPSYFARNCSCTSGIGSGIAFLLPDEATSQC